MTGNTYKQSTNGILVLKYNKNCIFFLEWHVKALFSNLNLLEIFTFTLNCQVFSLQAGRLVDGDLLASGALHDHGGYGSHIWSQTEDYLVRTALKKPSNNPLKKEKGHEEPSMSPGQRIYLMSPHSKAYLIFLQVQKSTKRLGFIAWAL